MAPTNPAAGGGTFITALSTWVGRIVVSNY